MALASCSWGHPATPEDPTAPGSGPSGGGSSFQGGDGAVDDASSPNAGTIVLIADGPSHGKREHEYRAGTILLKLLLEQSPGVKAVLLPSFPDDRRQLNGARAIVLMTSGRDVHPLTVGNRAEILDAQLRNKIGYAAIHFSTDVLEPLSPKVMSWTGGHAIFPQSVYADWDASFDTIPDHPITHGVPPFGLRDEFYYQLRFASAGVTPILQAQQPNLGRPETVAWTWIRPQGGGRSFSYTGMHYHDHWLALPVRQLLVNAILWIADYDVPEAGAPVAMDAALINENLDPK